MNGLYAVDSRKVVPGAIFFALQGAKSDGHLFLEEVARRGASIAFVKNGYQGEHFGLELLFVEDPLTELHRLAKEKMANATVIGVTGSFAKTTTKEALGAALGGFKSPANANSQVGLPLAILNGYRGESLAILEMGIQYPGEMDRLARMVEPEIAVITRIGEAHLEPLGGRDGVLREKGKIVVQGKTKHLFLHHSVPEIVVPETISNAIAIHRYGNICEKRFADLADLCRQMQELLGRPLTSFVMPAIALRNEERVYLKGTVVLDCYNASPTTMEQFFLESAKRSCKGRRVAIIGQMAELGEESEQYHLQTLEAIKQTFDIAFFIGEEARIMEKTLVSDKRVAFFAENLEELQNMILKEVRAEDLVLVKGSNSNRLWEIAPCLEQILSI